LTLAVSCKRGCGHMTGRRTDSASKGPKAEWRKQQDQERSSEDETMRLHAESFEYKYEKNVSAMSA